MSLPSTFIRFDLRQTIFASHCNSSLNLQLIILVANIFTFLAFPMLHFNLPTSLIIPDIPCILFLPPLPANNLDSSTWPYKKSQPQHLLLIHLHPCTSSNRSHHNKPSSSILTLSPPPPTIQPALPTLPSQFPPFSLFATFSSSECSVKPLNALSAKH